MRGVDGQPAQAQSLCVSTKAPQIVTACPSPARAASGRECPSRDPLLISASALLLHLSGLRGSTEWRVVVDGAVTEAGHGGKVRLILTYGQG